METLAPTSLDTILIETGMSMGQNTPNRHHKYGIIYSKFSGFNIESCGPLTCMHIVRSLVISHISVNKASLL